MSDNTNAGMPTAPIPTNEGAAAGPDWGQPMVPPSGAAPKRRKGVALLATGATVAVVGLGVGGAYAFRALSGGGAQPEEALPANTFLFAKLDLDPSSGQKIDAIRFARKFPSKETSALKDDTDLRKTLFEAMQKDGEFKGLSYDTDVKPWIGSRVAVGVVPSSTGAEPIPVVVLAVTDQAKAKTSLAKMTDDKTSCNVGAEFALCGQTESAVQTVVDSAAKSNLTTAANFKSDMSDLGEDGIASFWMDLGQVVKEFKAAAASGLPGAGSQTTQDALAKAKGRVFGAIRFDGPNLDLVGSVRDSANITKADKGTQIGNLPADTIAAFSANGLGDNLVAQWGQLEKAFSSTTPDGTDPLATIEQQTGLKLPDDLAKLLGKHTTIAFGGMGQGSLPKIAIKTDGDAAIADKIKTLVANQGQSLEVRTGDGSLLFALDPAYADAIQKGSGLGDSERFTTALPDADSAQAALYVDLAKAIESFGSSMSAEDKAKVANLSAFGMTATADGANGDFRLRLTTK